LTAFGSRAICQAMFIREIRKVESGSKKSYVYHRLMESVRTPRGPRQRIVLNLGKLESPREEWKSLANRIEEILTGQQRLPGLRASIEGLAQHYASLIRRKEMQSVPSKPSEASAAEWEKVDLNSITQEEVRTVGGEIIGWWAFKTLGVHGILEELGLNERQVELAALLVVGRLLHPGSERETALWGKQVSGFDEVLGTSFEHLSNNALYRLSDALVAKKEQIEEALVRRERSLLGLRETIILYDLTNTYFCGTGADNSLAKRGPSKEKRTDCPLVTLALALDEDGFPKASRTFAGNVSEPATFREILRVLPVKEVQQRCLFENAPTVVMDAGIATNKNLEILGEEGFHYICVSRARPKEPVADELEVIREHEGSVLVRGRTIESEGETLLYCESEGRARKEESMKALFQKRFEEGLSAIADSLVKKRGVKDYQKVLERLGKLKGKYPSVSRFYDIQVDQENEIATAIRWSIQDQAALDFRFSGAYLLRTDRKDLKEKELWTLYNTLTHIEGAFRSLKSELGLRPVFHRVSRRIEGHLFITVLAYHLLAVIERKLRKNGVRQCWESIRTLMATQVRVTVSLSNYKGERIHIRQTTEPEPFHKQIFGALELPAKSLKTTRVKM
jgi:transposase